MSKEVSFFERSMMENHGCRRKRRRGWERIVWFGRLFIRRGWCACVF